MDLYDAISTIETCTSAEGNSAATSPLVCDRTAMIRWDMLRAGSCRALQTKTGVLACDESYLAGEVVMFRGGRDGLEELTG